MQRPRTRFVALTGLLITATVVAGVIAVFSEGSDAPPTGKSIEAAASRPVHPEKTRAIEFVRSEALAISGSADPGNDVFRAYAAVSAASYVRTLMSSARHSRALSTPGNRVRYGTEICLAEMRGICGDHATGFLDIMKALGVPAREVQVYYVDKAGNRASHVLVEVYWKEAWRMIDVTWGFIPHNGRFTDALSFAQARQRGGTAGWHDELNTWRVSAATAKADMFEYLSAPSVDVVIEGRGTIHPYVREISEDRVIYGLEHIPSYIGARLMRGGLTGELVYEVELPPGYSVLTLVPRRGHCESGILFANGQGRSVPTMQPIVFAGVGRKAALRIENPGKQCFLELKELYATKDVSNLQ